MVLSDAQIIKKYGLDYKVLISFLIETRTQSLADTNERQDQLKILLPWLHKSDYFSDIKMFISPLRRKGDM